MLALSGIRKQFADQAVLRGLDLTVARGETVALLGPSGCGKTTLLRIIAGLEKADAGGITLAGRDLSALPIHRRGIGMVFQDYALFPHMSVAGNVAFGLRMAGLAPDARAARVDDVLALVGLAGFEKRDVHALSGGEQQRVALARALAPGPGLLLLDEPLGALDRALREQLLGELREILAETPDVTAIYVTHDQAEAYAVADRVAVMNEGRFEQIAAPMTLFQAPRTAFVARFLGMPNVLPLLEAGDGWVETALGRLPFPHLPAGAVALLVRPEAMAPLAPAEAGALVWDGVVSRRSFRGRHLLLDVVADGPRGPVPLRLELSGAWDAVGAAGAAVRLRLDPAALVPLFA